MIVALLISLNLFALGCSQPPPGRGAGEVETSPQTQSSFKVETVIPNLEVVWSIVWAPDGRMLFTERPGRVRVFENGKLRPQPLFVVPDVEPRGESGLMGLALHPQFAAKHGQEAGPATTRPLEPRPAPVLAEAAARGQDPKST